MNRSTIANFAIRKLVFFPLALALSLNLFGESKASNDFSNSQGGFF